MSFVILLLAGCSKSEPVSLANAFPGADVVSGWTPADDVQTFDRETLFNLVDGQADAFFAYGFEQVAVRSYTNAQGAVLGIEVWQLATSADAYGLFTSSLGGEPVAVGNEGDTEAGRRIIFWQDRYYVQVYGRQELPDADLHAFARALAAALPQDGERPALVGRLPSDGLVERGFVSFHEEISIQDRLWLGGENILGLGQETDGVLAQYALDGAAAQLLLVEYPSAAQAAAGLAALQASGVEGLLAADARGNLLGAVFGEADATTASKLLNRALQ